MRTLKGSRKDAVLVQFKSAGEACAAIGVPFSKVFRRELKRRGHMILRHEGEEHLFRVEPRKEPKVFEV